MWQILAAVLALILIAVLIRYQLLKNNLARMAGDMADIHSKGNKRQLTIGFQQPQLAKLAASINTLYNDVDTEKAAHRTAMAEMRQSMADISHDLRTPLTSILGYLKLLRGNNNTAEQEQHYLEVAYRKASSLNQLINGLFELARLESGGYIFKHKRVDVAALLREELADSYAIFEGKGVLPIVTLPEKALPMVGDEGALSRVFSNLLQNMVKHGQAPMNISGMVEGKKLVCVFSNGAPTLTSADIPQMFHRFYTGDRMRTGKDTGLGLAIVKEFTQQMQGTVSAALKDNILVITLSWPLG